MSKKRNFYVLVAVAASVFIFYIIYMYGFRDPGASSFLSHKPGSRYPENKGVWMAVMRVHAILASAAMIIGIVNFSKTFQNKFRKWHRINGYLYLLCVFFVVLTSGYMAPYSTGGRTTSIAFNVLSMIWFAMTVIAIVKAKKKQIDQHRKWIVRSFAFCFTNMFIHLYTSILHYGFQMPYTESYTIGIYAAIITLFALAEYAIRHVLDIRPEIAKAIAN
ncbi:DUF2306 domain-containing protein [Paenibacillus sp. GCM10027627]|uniref:DUF2306 domain-containing protein n=1 Tax=unclassified Paenibacillus TaxID=185978 RepID=UPI00362BFBB3